MTKTNSTLENHLGLAVITSTYWNSYTGTKDELIDEGLCTHDLFPEGKKRRKDNLDEHGQWDGHMEIRCVKGKRYELTIYHERKQIAPERTSNYESLDTWKNDSEKFIETILNMINLTITGESEKFTYGETTICFDKKTQERVKSMIHEIESAIRVGECVWSGKAKNTKKNLPKAKQDKDFQSFLTGLTK